jgi:hypothetical protein
VTVWFLERAEEMINFPVRPEPPRMRKCILDLDFNSSGGRDVRIVVTVSEVLCPWR